MKRKPLIIIALLASLVSQAQETLQTVTDRGSGTSNGKELQLYWPNGLGYTFLGGYSNGNYGRLGAWSPATGGFSNLVINEGGGNVGIGTSNPTAKLTVAGNIQAREVKVSVDAGADYVFQNGYDLRPIEDLNAFISKNKHLPEIAPADQMTKDGVNLSEMNIKLLKKIEELTLYLIDINKQLKDLKEENRELRNLISK